MNPITIIEQVSVSKKPEYETIIFRNNNKYRYFPKENRVLLIIKISKYKDNRPSIPTRTIYLVAYQHSTNYQ